MNRLNQMFRDFKVAEDVGKMMELRRFEVEFELYGTVYWENGQRYYLVGKNEAVICQQISELELRNKYPVPLQIWREKCLVPAGWDEEIEQQVKIHFCQALQETYPKIFWEAVFSVVDGKENDSGTTILDPLQEQLDGRFQEDELQLFCGLLHLLYLRKNLTERSFQAYGQWLEEVRQEMINNIAEKDIFSKEFFGFAYQKEDNSICYVINASQQFIQKKRMEIILKKEGMVTPIFYKKYWYNYDYRLEQVRKDFGDELRILYSKNYFAILKQIHALPITINGEAYQEKKQQLQTEKLRTAWEGLGRQWGIVE